VLYIPNKYNWLVKTCLSFVCELTTFAGFNGLNIASCVLLYNFAYCPKIVENFNFFEILVDKKSS
jgi:hypothetical protein